MTTQYTQAQLEYVQTHPEWGAAMATLAAARERVKDTAIMCRVNLWTSPILYGDYTDALDARRNAENAASELQQRLAAQYQPATE